MNKRDAAFGYQFIAVARSINRFQRFAKRFLNGIFAVNVSVIKRGNAKIETGGY